MRGSSVEDGFRDVSYSQLAGAINKLAWLIQKKLGRSKTFATLTYMGPLDLMYPIFAVAAQKTGYKALLTSPRNSLEAHLSLLEASNCNVFLAPEQIPTTVATIMSKRLMQLLVVPFLDFLLLESTESIPHFPFDKSFDEAQAEPFFLLHTSGSTGTPKLITITHGAMTPGYHFRTLSSKGYSSISLEKLAGLRTFLGLPPFHAAGIYALLAVAVYYAMVPITGPVNQPMNADMLDAIHASGNVQASVAASSLLEEITKSPSYLENLKSLEMVAYGGGPLNKNAGDKIVKRTSLISYMGATETMLLPLEFPQDKNDWQYCSFSPCAGVEMRQSSDDLYELFIIRKPQWIEFQGIFFTFPDLEEYSMKDLYSRHLTKDLWLYRGRSDDVIVFSNGEKLNPLGMEQIIENDPFVRSALVGGQGRFQSMLLIELKEPPETADTTSNVELLNTIWPIIEQANSACPAYSKVSKEFVLFTTSAKLMLRAGKGTVQRMPTMKHFEKEIDALYKNANNSLDQTSITSLSTTLHTTVAGVLGPEVAVHDDDNFFELGMDSLQVVNLTRKLNEEFHEEPHVSTSTIYSNPTVDKLAYASLAMLQRKPGTGIPAQSPEDQMQTLLSELSEDLPISLRATKPSSDTPIAIILTGSTGSIGSYVLDLLLSDTYRVAKVYCFIRAHNSDLSPLARQREVQQGNGLSTNLEQERVHFLEVDFSQQYFGLIRSDYIKLLGKVTHILHLAWEVDFNLPLESFAPTHLHGIRQFIDFSSRSAYGPSINFASSIGSVAQWASVHKDNSLVPEVVFENWALPQATGYGRSKAVAERLLYNANAVAGVPSTIFRVGQIAGPTTSQGVWNRREWFPSLIASSRFLGVVPADLGPLEAVDWVPVDLAAKIMVELLLESSAINESTGSGTNGVPKGDVDGGHVYHLTNPHGTTYTSLLPTIVKHLPPSTKPIPFAAWVDCLAKSSSGDDNNPNPAIKLLDIFESLVAMEGCGESMPILDPRKTLTKSRTMASLEPISERWMDTWMKQWGFAPQQQDIG
ncbi:hypothetical protein MMC13_005311 [Lambiella insularis]|nr:hypothetical protein [Lambiella insularis]